MYLFDDSGYRQIAFEETKHYKVTRDFSNNPQGMLRHLLAR
jgi:predicted ATPase